MSFVSVNIIWVIAGHQWSRQCEDSNKSGPNIDLFCLPGILIPRLWRHHVQRGSAKHSVKGGLAFLWEMRFFDPPQLSPQWSDNNEILHMWLRHGDHAPCKFLPSYLCQSAPWNGVKYNQFVSVPFFLFVFPSPRHAPRRVGRFSRSMRQMTSFRWRMCLLGVRIAFYSIWWSFAPKNRPKKALKGEIQAKTENQRIRVKFCNRRPIITKLHKCM